MCFLYQATDMAKTVSRALSLDSLVSYTCYMGKVCYTRFASPYARAFRDAGRTCTRFPVLENGHFIGGYQVGTCAVKREVEKARMHNACFQVFVSASLIN